MYSLLRLAARRRIVLAAAICIACGGSDTTAPGAPPIVTPTLAAQIGATQSAIVGTVAAENPTVLVTDNHGAHAAGITVTFTPDSGAGTVTTLSVTTDTSGTAAAGRWTVGTHAQVQHLTASATVDGTLLRATFAVTASPSKPAVLRVVSSALDGPFGATLVTPVQVVAEDMYNNPTSGVSVRFSVDTGGVISASATTATDGTASTRVRLPVTTGPVVLTIASDSLPTITTTLTSRGIRFASFTMFAGSTCGLSVEGYPYCWGNNTVGQLVPTGGVGQQHVDVPQPIAADLDLTSISLDNLGGCALRKGGSAVCWGSNVYGSNGNGHVSLQLEPITPVSGGLSFVELLRGPAVTCGTTTTGQSYCWGGGAVGQAGAANIYQSSANAPALIDSGITFHSYALGSLHTCALDPTGRAYCWGMNFEGRLGVAVASRSCGFSTVTPQGTTTIATTCSPSPVAVNTSLRFTVLAGASDATCGLDASGVTYCWGSNDLDQMGNGGIIADTVPTQVPGAPVFKQLSGHDRGFCGLTSAGDIYCWGYVTSALGVPNLICPNFADCTPTPTKLQTTRRFTSIAFTTGQICGLSDGVAYCWGENSSGSLGIGNYSRPTAGTPTEIAGQTP
ncbi:MAG: hypothetical protein ABI229_09690 [Gemmatimonadaceae bacterium]